MKTALLILGTWAELAMGGLLDESPQAPVRWGGAPSTSTSEDVFFGPSAPPEPAPGPRQGGGFPPPDPGTPRTCHVLCGPNDQRFLVRYYCEAQTATVSRNGVVLARIEGCRGDETTQCLLLSEGTRLTFYGRNYGRADGTFRHDPLGNLACRPE